MQGRMEPFLVERGTPLRSSFGNQPVDKNQRSLVCHSPAVGRSTRAEWLIAVEASLSNRPSRSMMLNSVAAENDLLVVVELGHP